MKDKGGFVYIMTNKYNLVFYVGVTSDLQRRVYQHKNHIYEGFTDRYNCEKLVYYEFCNDIESAISREKQIKNWRRSWKKELVDKMNPQWKDLSASWFKDTAQMIKEFQERYMFDD